MAKEKTSVVELVHGRVCMGEEELELLCEAVQGASSYVEIGTLWGGSLIAALSSNHDLVGWAIDPMTGYYGGVDEDGTMPTESLFWENCQAAAVVDRVHLVKENSWPWPLEEYLRPDVILIDGDHSALGVFKDWVNASIRARRFVIFHDIDDPEVREVIDDVIRGGGLWKVFKKTERMMVVERRIKEEILRFAQDDGGENG